MIILRNEPEIFPYDKNKPQILTGNTYVENVSLAVGFASRCWKEENGKGEFDVDQAMRLVNELCAYVRILSSDKNNLEFLEWKYEKKNKELSKKNKKGESKWIS